MKKKVLSTILSIAMVAAMLMGCTTESPASSDSGEAEKESPAARRSASRSRTMRMHIGQAL